MGVWGYGGRRVGGGERRGGESSWTADAEEARVQGTGL